MISDAFTAVVEVFGLNRAGQGAGDSAVRRGRKGQGWALKLEPVQNEQIQVTGIAEEHEIKGVRAAGIRNSGCHIRIGSTRKRHKGGAEKGARGGVGMGFDAAAKSVTSDPERNTGDVGEANRVESDVAAVGDVNDVEAATVRIAGGGEGDGGVHGAELSLFVTWRKNGSSRAGEWQDVGRAAVGVSGVEDEKEIVGVGIGV